MSGFRYISVPGTDNSEAILGRENQTPAFASSIAIATIKEKTKVWIALTGALALTAVTTHTKQGDELDVILSADGSNRTVTPGSGFSGLTASTIVCAANKKATISFIFDGTNWCEKNRAVMV